MDFTGEHLLPGQLGHFFLLLSFISSIGATVAYFISVQKGRRGNLLTEEAQWKKLARIFFITEAISVFAVFAILFLYHQQPFF